MTEAEKIIAFYESFAGKKRTTIQANFVRHVNECAEYIRRLESGAHAGENLGNSVLTHAEYTDLRTYRSRICEAQLSEDSGECSFSSEINMDFVRNDAQKAVDRYNAQIDGGSIFMEFKDCKIGDLDFGDFRVESKIERGGLRYFTAQGIGDNTFCDSMGGEYIHPHLSGNDELEGTRDICLGDHRDAIIAAMLSGRLLDAALVFTNILNTYGSNPYTKIDYWRDIWKCKSCGNSTRSHSTCNLCDAECCPSCSSDCPECGETICNSCGVQCVTCKALVCEECIDHCSICGDAMCTPCVFVKEVDGKDVKCCSKCYGRG